MDYQLLCSPWAYERLDELKLASLEDGYELPVGARINMTPDRDMPRLSALLIHNGQLVAKYYFTGENDD